MVRTHRLAVHSELTPRRRVLTTRIEWTTYRRGRQDETSTKPKGGVQCGLILYNML